MLSSLIERRQRLENEIDAVQSLYNRYGTYVTKLSRLEKDLKSDQTKYGNSDNWMGKKHKQFKNEAEQNITLARTLSNEASVYRQTLKHWLDHLYREKSKAIADIDAERRRIEQELKGERLR